MDLGRFETSLDVRDIGTSLTFYQALGFRCVNGAVEIRTVTLRRGDCRLCLYQGYLQPARTQLIFWQGDVLSIARDLIGKGLSFEAGHPRTADDGGASAMLIDPDGHPIYFITMPVNFPNDPAYTHKSPPYRPRRLKPDKRLGWFELSLDVADVERSVAFYGKLGFRPVGTNDEGPGATLQNADCRIALCRGGLGPARARLTLRQGDIEAIGQNLLLEGLSFEEGPAQAEGAVASKRLKDPDGIPILFVNTPGMVRREPT